MRARFAASDDPATIDDIVWLAGWSQDSTTDWESVIKMAEKNVARRPDDWSYRESLGAVLFRGGRYQEAVNVLRNLVAQRKEADITPWTGTFLAMALFNTARKEDAIREHGKARDIMQKHLATRADDNSSIDWTGRLQYRLLLDDLKNMNIQ